MCVLVAVLLGLLVPPLYQSDATVLINKLGREFTYRSELSVGPSSIVPMTNDPEEILNTQVQLLRSRDVVMAVIERVGLSRLYPELIKPNEPPDLDRVATTFLNSLKAIPQRTSNILLLSFSHSQRELAQATLEALIDVFREKSIDVYLNTQTRFYEEQVEQAASRFSGADARLGVFRNRNGVLAFAQQKALLLQQRLDFDTDMKRVAAELEGTRARAASVQARMDATPADVTAFTDTQPSRVVEDARTKLLNLRLRQQEIAANFAPDSRQVRQAAQEIAIAEQFLAQQSARFSGTVRKARNDVASALEQELNRALADQAALAARLASLTERLADIDRQITAMTDTETERWTLEREVESAQENLKIYMGKLDEARAADQLNKGRIGNIAIVQAPSLPDARQPVHPRPVRYLLLGLLAGLLGAFAVALLSELASDTIYDPVRTERQLNLPTLAVFDLAEERG